MSKASNLCTGCGGRLELGEAEEADTLRDAATKRYFCRFSEDAMHHLELCNHSTYPRDDGGCPACEEALGLPPGGYTVVGVRAPYWAEQTKAEPETVIFERQSRTDATWGARFLSRSHMDDGAVDFWPEVGGHTEIRDGSGKLIAAYLDGRRFSPAQWAKRQEAVR
jgi:hypothetical protein